MNQNRTGLVQEIQQMIDESSEQVIAVKDLSDDGILTVRLSGPCAQCPTGQLDAQETWDRLFVERFPAVKEVRWETGVSDELIQEALRFLRKK